MSIRYPIIVLLVIIIVTIVTVLSIPRVKRSIHYEHPRQLHANHPNLNVIVIEMEEILSNTSDAAEEPLVASSSAEYEELITYSPDIQDDSEVNSTATKDESVTETNLFGPYVLIEAPIVCPDKQEIDLKGNCRDALPKT